MTMTRLRLIELLTWTAVEISKPCPQNHRALSEAIDLALAEALICREREALQP